MPAADTLRPVHLSPRVPLSLAENADVLAALDALRGPLDEYSNESVGSATINLDGERVQVPQHGARTPASVG